MAVESEAVLRPTADGFSVEGNRGADGMDGEDGE